MYKSPITESQVRRIDEEACRILERSGFRVMDAEACRACAEAGARVDSASGTVRFPRALLDELLGQAPRSYAIAGIDGRVRQIGAGQPWGVAIVTDPWIIDYETQRPRRPRLDDLRRHTIIAQKMDHVAAVSRMDFPVSDVPEPGSSLRALEEHLVDYGKHYYFVPAETASNRQWRRIIEIVSRGGYNVAAPLFSIMVAVISPLAISGINVDLMRLAIEYGAPIVPTICPMAGSTSPYTLAGTLLQGHCENLAMAALTQVMKPGHPFLYAFGPSVTDMRSGHDLYYTLDKALWKGGAVQLAKARGIPATAECGGTMTYRYDQQNGAEGMLFMLAAVGSGADMLAGFGSCYTAMGMSAEMMVIHEAWMSAARFLLRGIDTSEDRLAADSIMSAGPSGQFMTDELTLRFLHEPEFFAHELFDHSPCGEEGRSLLERAHAKAEELTAAFESPVPAPVQEELRRFFHDERARLERET